MAGEQVDLALTEVDGYYDISFAENGDLATTEGLDTSLLVTFFTDRRADVSEVPITLYQRGWWGTLFNTASEVEIGSKIWLLDQTVNTQDTLNNAIAYLQEAYGWLTRLGYADKVEVTGTSSFDTILLTVKIIKNNDVVSEKVYNLWANTVENINNG